MTKVYVIRKINFEWTDDNYVPDGWETIEGLFYDKNKAYVTYMELEKLAFVKEKQDIWYYRNFDVAEEGESANAKLAYFFEQNFGFDMQNRHKFYDSFVPENITYPQLEKLQNLMQARFYELLEFEEENACYYQIKMICRNFEDGYYSSVELKDKYDTFQEAQEIALRVMCDQAIQNVPFWDDLPIEQLTDSPELLKAFLDQCQYFECYEWEWEEFKIFYKTILAQDIEWEILFQEIRGIIAFLKNKPYLIEKVSYSSFLDKK